MVGKVRLIFFGLFSREQPLRQSSAFMQALQLAQCKVTKPNFMSFAVFGFGWGQILPLKVLFRIQRGQLLPQGIKRLDLFSLAPVLDVDAAHALLDVVLAFVDHVVGDA